MAERSQFWPTGTTGDGTTTITQDQALEWLRDLFTPHTAAGPNPVQGILYGVLGSLQVSAGSGVVTVAPGAAVVEGFYYKSDAPVVVSIPSSGGGRTDLIVLRANWATRQVRLARLAGIDGNPAFIPSLTQTAGVTWEIAIAQVLVLFSSTNPSNLSTAFARPIGTSPLWRQGGDATVWSIQGAGSIAIPPSSWGMQTGVLTSTGTALAVTFPTPFAQPPVVIVSNGLVSSSLAGGFIASTNTSNQVTQWLAIGPVVL
jgi:hypothetical protein